MPRPQKFDQDMILDAALKEGSRHGFETVSVSRIASRLGAPSGSLYHRYRSRDALVVELWLRTVERFQTAYVSTLAGKQPAKERVRGSIQFVFDWCKEHRAEAEMLMRYRRKDLLKGNMPSSISRRAAVLNEPAKHALNQLAHDLNPSSPDIERVRFVCITLPMAAVRESLVAGERPSESVIQLVDEAASALLSTEL